VIDRHEKTGSIGLLVALGIALVAAASVLALMKPAEAAPYVQVLLGILAVVGVFALFASAIGLVRFGHPPAARTLADDVVDGFPEGVVVTDADGRIVYGNTAYFALCHAGRDADLRTPERLFSADSLAAEPMFRLAAAARDRRAETEEIRTLTPLGRGEAGGPRWYRVRVRPLVVVAGGDVDGGIGGGSGSGGDGAKGGAARAKAGEAKAGRSRPLTVWQVADVTDDRNEQESSFQELQQVVTFLDHAPAGFFSADAEGRIVYLNATLADWLGHDLARFAPGTLRLRDIVQGQGALLLDQPGGGDQSRTRIVDLDLVKKNGQSLPVRLLHRVLPAAGGGVGDSRTLVINRSAGEDVSEALRAAEVRFARFFNSTPIAITALDREGRIGRSNAPFLKLFGDLIRDGGGRSRLVDLVVESDRSKLVGAIAAAARGQGVIPPVDVTIAGDQPKQRSVRFFVSSVEDGAGDGEAAVVYGLDTTQQRELELQFAQSQKMQGIGQLAGGIAHDFNNVLTAIIGFSDLLLNNHRPSDPSFQDIMNIKQNANRAASLVRQLLAFSRRQTLRPEVIRLTDTIADLSMMLGRLLGEKVELKVVHGRDLWSVKADISQLEQVIVNLAVNARDAMPEGGRLTITTGNLPAGAPTAYETPGMPAGDYVYVDVADTGTGIPPEIMEKIFEPFFTTKPVGQGTGLGLSTVYGIVKQTGGFVYCSSAIGAGTTFHILLPRHVETMAEKAEARAEATPQATDLTGSATILLVEDEEAVRAFGKRALMSRGYTVHEAGSGTEALEVMEETGGKIDLVVSDVVMPEMDGPSLLRELRKTRPDLKIIFVSGYAEDAFARNLPVGEQFHFLPKPFSLKQLATAVKEALGR
jgi:two-component system cell cycle sensor histidine kinase/response regulator CckA